VCVFWTVGERVCMLWSEERCECVVCVSKWRMSVCFDKKSCYVNKSEMCVYVLYECLINSGCKKCVLYIYIYIYIYL